MGGGKILTIVQSEMKAPNSQWLAIPGTGASAFRSLVAEAAKSPSAQRSDSGFLGQQR